MILDHGLRPLTISNGTNDFYPVLDSRGHVRQLELFNKMGGKYTTVSRVDIKAVVDLEALTMIELLSEGVTVTTPLGTFKPNAKGRVGLDLQTGLETGQITYEISFTAGPELAQAMAQMFSERRVGPLDRPYPRYAVDDTTKTYNKWLTPGGTGYVKGDNLSFNSEDARQGVFIVELGAEGVEFRAALTGTPSAGKIPVTYPADLQPGKKYKVEVRAEYVKEGDDKVLRVERVPFSAQAPAS